MNEETLQLQSEHLIQHKASNKVSFVLRTLIEGDQTIPLPLYKLCFQFRAHSLQQRPLICLNHRSAYQLVHQNSPGEFSGIFQVLIVLVWGDLHP